MGMSLRDMLCQERHEQDQWTQHAQTSRSACQNPLWKRILAGWFFSMVDSLEQFDGNHGNFTPSIAYSAMSFVDVYLSLCPVELRERARSDMRAYDTLGATCLYLAAARIAPGNEGHGILIAGHTWTSHIFLLVCNRSRDASVEDFDSTLASILEFIRPLDSFKHDATPLVAADFFDVLGEFLLSKSNGSLKYNEATSERAKAAMDHTLATARFASYAPSLVATSAFVVALQDDNDREMLVMLLEFYKLSGGYELSFLHDVIHELSSAEAEEEGRRRQRQSHVIEGIAHATPDDDDDDD